MQVIELADEHRSAIFHVERFELTGVMLSATAPGERAIAEALLGTPIDLDWLRGAKTVSGMMAMIAINHSNVMCAALSHIYLAPGRVQASSTLVSVSLPDCDATASCFTEGPCAVGSALPAQTLVSETTECMASVSIDPVSVS